MNSTLQDCFPSDCSQQEDFPQEIPQLACAPLACHPMPFPPLVFPPQPCPPLPCFPLPCPPQPCPPLPCFPLPCPPLPCFPLPCPPQPCPPQPCFPQPCPPQPCPPCPVPVIDGRGYHFWNAECLPAFQEICLHSCQHPKEHWLYTMYHGTTYAAAIEIIRHGFNQSADGMLGRGVYASRDIQKAMKYPLNNSRKVVLQLRVNVGKVIKIDHPNHPLQKTWHNYGFDTAWVPPNTMNPSGQEEDCVYDPQRIKVIDIALGNPDDVRILKHLLNQR